MGSVATTVALAMVIAVIRMIVLTILIVTITAVAKIVNLEGSGGDQIARLSAAPQSHTGVRERLERDPQAHKIAMLVPPDLRQITFDQRV